MQIFSPVLLDPAGRLRYSTFKYTVLYNWTSRLYFYSMTIEPQHVTSASLQTSWKQPQWTKYPPLLPLLIKTTVASSVPSSRWHIFVTQPFVRTELRSISTSSSLLCGLKIKLMLVPVKSSMKSLQQIKEEWYMYFVATKYTWSKRLNAKLMTWCKWRPRSTRLILSWFPSTPDLKPRLFGQWDLRYHSRVLSHLCS